MNCFIRIILKEYFIWVNKTVNLKSMRYNKIHLSQKVYFLLKTDMTGVFKLTILA